MSAKYTCHHCTGAQTVVSFSYCRLAQRKLQCGNQQMSWWLSGEYWMLEICSLPHGNCRCCLTVVYFAQAWCEIQFHKDCKGVDTLILLYELWEN